MAVGRFARRFWATRRCKRRDIFGNTRRLSRLRARFLRRVRRPKGGVLAGISFRVGTLARFCGCVRRANRLAVALDWMTFAPARPIVPLRRGCRRTLPDVGSDDPLSCRSSGSSDARSAPPVSPSHNGCPGLDSTTSLSYENRANADARLRGQSTRSGSRPERDPNPLCRESMPHLLVRTG